MNDSMIRELSIDGCPILGETWGGRGTQWGSGSRFGYPVAPGFLAPWHIEGDDGFIKFGGGSDGGGRGGDDGSIKFGGTGEGIWPSGGGGKNGPTDGVEFGETGEGIIDWPPSVGDTFIP